MPIGELGIFLAVRDAFEGGVVVEAADKDLVHYFLRLLATHLPHSQDGAQGPSTNTFLGDRETRQRLQLTRCPDVGKYHQEPRESH